MGWTASTVLITLLPFLTGERIQHATVLESLWSGQVVAAAEQSEFHVRLYGRAPGASWRKPGQETAVVQVLVDGRYDQHLFLTGGENPLQYDFIVGPLLPGNHVLQLEWQRDWTPGLTQQPKLTKVRAIPLRRADAASEPELRAPTIYLRPDTVGHFTDLPLLLYWERDAHDGRVVYTIILSNEDGGTNTERLMARWGRTTDIEWCYAYSRTGDEVQGTYQARDHETLRFKGAYDGWHPRLFDASHNNIFSDQPAGPETVRVRPFPVHQDLRGKTRESVMDRNPWIYPLMADEMIREGKFEYPAYADSATVSDVRNYAYLDVCAQQRGTELRFEAQLRDGRRWYSSDHGDPKSRIERSGCFRSSIELPQGTAPAQLSALRIECLHKPVQEGEKPIADPQCRIEGIGPFFLLQTSYYPAAPLRLRPARAATLKPGDSLQLRSTAEPAGPPGRVFQR